MAVHRYGSAILAALIAECAVCSQADASLTREIVATGVTFPTHVAAPPGDTARLFIVTRDGIIYVLDLLTNTIGGAPFLDISPQVETFGEGGLLSLAFHPQYLSNGFFFVYYTSDLNPGPSVQLGSTVSRFTVSANPDVADAASETMFFVLAQPFSNHNGGMASFRPGDANHYLYVSLGDGGSQCDPGQRAQDITNKFGSILRFDVDAGPSGDVNNPYAPPGNPFVGITGDDTIWVYGLRNPYRFSFDPLTSDLYIGDVGGQAREEIDFQAAGSAGGENYGWNATEGTLTPPLNCTGVSPVLPGMIAPIHEYAHNGFGASVIGGHVYRGERSPSLVGRYFFADFITEKIWSAAVSGGTFADLRDHTAILNPNNGGICSFGTDAAGELYAVESSGVISRIVDDAPFDADQDLLPDWYEDDTGVFVDGAHAGSDPNDQDTDGDGVIDGTEVEFGTDPNNPLEFPSLSLSWIFLVSSVAVGATIASSLWYSRRVRERSSDDLA